MSPSVSPLRCTPSRVTIKVNTLGDPRSSGTPVSTLPVVVALGSSLHPGVSLSLLWFLLPVSVLSITFRFCFCILFFVLLPQSPRVSSLLKSPPLPYP